MPYPIDSELRERLEAIRKWRGLSPAELAEKAGVDNKTEYKIRTGQANSVQEKTLHQLAEALDVSFPRLVGDKRIPGFDPPWWIRSRRLFATLAIVLLVGAVGVGIERGDRSVLPKCYRPYAEGRVYLKKLYRDDARRCFLQAIECDSTFSMAYAMLIHPEMWNTNEERIRWAGQARKYSSRVKGANHLFVDAMCAWQGGNLPVALDALERLVDLKDMPEAYRLLGKLYWIRRDLPKAVASYETALAADRDDGPSWNRLAYMYATLGRAKEAVNAVDTYIALSPHEANPYDTKGDILSRLGRCDEAIACYQTALSLKPDFQPSTQSLGVIYALQGDYAEANTYFNKLATFNDPGARSRGFYFLASIPIVQGDYVEGLSQLDKAIAADELMGQLQAPYYWKLQARADILEEIGRSDEAIHQYRALLERIEADLPSLLPEWLPGYIWLVAGHDPKMARNELTRFQADTSDDFSASAQFLRLAEGWIALEEGDADSACRLLEEAAQYENDICFRYPLALAYYQAGHTDRAIEVLNKAMQTCAGDHLAYATLSNRATKLARELSSASTN